MPGYRVPLRPLHRMGEDQIVLGDEFIAIGYVPGKGFGGIGKVLLPQLGTVGPAYADGIGTGFNTESEPTLKKRLDTIRTERSPITGLKEKGVVWARPEVVVEVEYRGWTEGEQHLPHPSYKGSRDDKTVAALWHPSRFGARPAAPRAWPWARPGRDIWRFVRWNWPRRLRLRSRRLWWRFRRESHWLSPR
ncbi:hypothetical protein [Chelativorans salis]|uniref:ATP dependent DNA ligase n=1 Tax=Chelativorans salis TaxID=2978478 RepID=UPI003CC532A9